MVPVTGVPTVPVIPICLYVFTIFVTSIGMVGMYCTVYLNSGNVVNGGKSRQLYAKTLTFSVFFLLKNLIYLMLGWTLKGQ